tara:strand:- start:6473 stop:7018 length:546 start_codon:yes stop_codon:yes gene_type:complete
MVIKLLILDVDGVLTDGTKVYDSHHNVLSKRFSCKDFTAIKRFIAAGVKVVMLSGDIFNKAMADKRNIDFYCSRNKDLSLDKARYVEVFSEKYGIKPDDMAFVGDDYFDLSIFQKLNLSFCPNDAPQLIKDSATTVLNAKGGGGVVVELYDLFVKDGWITEATPEDVALLDKEEITSQEMS